jgi:hypothetical protein
MKITDLSGKDLDAFEPEHGGVYRNLPNEMYHGLRSWVSSSVLKTLLRSYEYYLYSRQQEKVASAPMEKGSAFHSAVEGFIRDGNTRQFDREVVTFSGKMVGSKEWHKTKLENPGCYVLSQTDRDEALLMASNVYRAGKDLRMWRDGETELSFFWIDQETKVRCKARCDFVSISNGLIVDHKSSKDISEVQFRRSVFNFHYDLSAAMYVEGVRVCTGVAPNFVLFAAANTPPHEVQPYVMDDDFMAKGLGEFRNTLSMLADPPVEKTEIRVLALGG